MDIHIENARLSPVVYRDQVLLYDIYIGDKWLGSRRTISGDFAMTEDDRNMRVEEQSDGSLRISMERGGSDVMMFVVPRYLGVQLLAELTRVIFSVSVKEIRDVEPE